MKRILPTVKGAMCALLTTVVAFVALAAGTPAASAAPGTSQSVDYASISYQWTDTLGNVHVSTLDQKADTYNQIVALLKEVYTNPAVPGFVKDPVGSTDPADPNTSIEVKYAPCTKAPYNMPADMKVPVPVEGATALLVELVDDYKCIRDEKDPPLTPEQMLRQVKAVSVLTKQMHIGEGVGATNPGYLFNYVGTLNKFFIITKGCNRVPKNNPEGFAPFYQMYEEFSPSNSGPIYDAFTDMNTGRQFAVDHNCSTILGQNHIVVMGPDTAPNTDYAVNFLFYLPDLRFSGDTRRKEGSSYVGEWYTYYSKDHMPFVFFSKIFASINELPVTDASTGKARVKLEWKSTYKEVSKSQVPEEFYVYRVIDDVIQQHPLSLSEFDIDTDAHPADMKIDDATGAIISTGPDCSIYVKEDLRSMSYNVRYIVLGRRWGSDFELTESNVVTALIPAADGPGDLEIRINGHGISQYDAEKELNNYLNSVSLLDHSVTGGRKLLRRHVSLSEGDTENPVFVLNRLNVKDGEIVGNPTEVARMQVIHEQSKSDVTYGDHYLYTARISYPANSNLEGLPTEASFISRKNRGDVADKDLPVEALSDNGDVIAMFADRFSASTHDGDQSESYGYYVEYVPGVSAYASARMDKTLSNMVEVTVPVRELKVGILPYTAEEIAADRDGETLLDPTPAALWIETRSNPNVSQYVVTDVTGGEDVAKVVRMATGRLEVSRKDASGRWEKCGSIENGYNAHPVIELVNPVHEGQELSLSLVYNNGNTYGNRRVAMPAMPSVAIDNGEIFKVGYVDQVNYEYFSSLRWSAVNAKTEDFADADSDHVIAGYRSWHTHGEGNPQTLVWGMDGDSEEIPCDAHPWGLTYTWFKSHYATEANPVVVEQKVRMYSVVPASMRIPRDDVRTAAMYAVSDASKQIVTKVVESLPTGVENIELPSGSEDYRYYDLTGREVKASELTKGVYIRTKGGKSEKVIF